MTNDEIESTLDRLIEITEKLAADLAPLVKATHVQFVPEERRVIEDRADGLVSEVHQLRQAFDEIRGISGLVPDSVLADGGFQRRVAK